MISSPNKQFAILFTILLLLPQVAILSQVIGESEVQIAPQSNMVLSDVPTDPIPLRKASFVAPDSNSYIDEFAYMAAVPTSIFYNSGLKYVSPLILSEGSISEQWLVEDWTEYLSVDGGISQGVAIGDFSDGEISALQEALGSKIFPRITGSTSAEIAAKLAIYDWQSADTVIVALSKDDFEVIQVTSGDSTHTFSSPAITPYTNTVVIPDNTPVDIPFTPPLATGWLDGSFNWTGSELFTHTLEDPLGNIVDYSFHQQVAASRSTATVPNPVPLHFWLPVTDSGEWTFHLTPQGVISSAVTLECEIIFHPGFTQSITVPSNAKWLNVSANWDNAGTILNLALIDPDGNLVQWAPGESLLSGAGSKSLSMPYPSPGDWKFIAAWMDPTAEENTVGVSWDISSFASDLQGYMESAANGASLASLLNAPLLYASPSSLPTITAYAIEHLNPVNIILVNPMGLEASILESELASLATFTPLSTYPLVSNRIHNLSTTNDIVLTPLLGVENEFFAPAAYSAAFHGAPVFSIGGSDNEMPTRAEQTWAPYQIGPQIDIFVTSRYTTRTENGWYDERIPNIYSMFKSATAFETFVTERGAYNSTTDQSVVIISPTEIIKTSFDRSLQNHFMAGRIPAETAEMASVMINRAVLHRFIFSTAESADEALLSFYAYTDSYTYYGIPFEQIEDAVASLESDDFSILSHVGKSEVFEAVASQVALWSLSTHGTLTQLPTDPPQRPEGPGIFSLRDSDLDYGEEATGVRDYDGNGLVNPVAFSPEDSHHVIATTDELVAEIDNIGSPIVIITACLLGGSVLPRTLMEHGAVAVTAAPRTVYFTPAGLLSVLLTESLVQGNTTGESLSYALRVMSFDYTDPLPSPHDYANQQVLFGDPSIGLYHPDSDPHIVALDPRAHSFGQHTPGLGIPGVVGLGVTTELPQTLTGLSVPFSFFDASNYSEFLITADLRTVVIVDSDTIDTLADVMATESDVLEQYVRHGGTLFVLGISTDIEWLPWAVTYQGGTSGNSVSLLESSHPLLISPNILSSTIDYEGHFASLSGNLTILSADGDNPVMLAGTYGNGKLALSTTQPTGAEYTNHVENAVYWNLAPSLIIESATKNQEIIWEGDVVTITINITDIVGNPIGDASVYAWFNDTSVSVTEIVLGSYSITVAGDWTNGRPGYFALRIHATKAGYDTLTAVLLDFMYIRPSPFLALALIGGGIVAVALVWQFAKRRRGEPEPIRPKSSPKRKMSKDEKRLQKKEDAERKKRQREKDKKFDSKEFFGVE
ncbi:MAG: hypothetical protein ACTSUO_07370 [Candidatus Thorarchaeota archaeon]